MLDVSAIDPEEYVQENRQQIIEVIRHSSDPFARACAWTLLDRYSDDPDPEDLHEEIDTLTGNGRATT